MNYRLLTPDEWPKLEPLFGDHPLPSPEASAIAVAEDDNQTIVGLLVLQLQWHLEPLVITNPQVNFLRLKSILDNQLQSIGGGCYYAFADTDKVARMAEHAGLAPQPMLVFKGDVQCA